MGYSWKEGGKQREDWIVVETWYIFAEIKPKSDVQEIRNSNLQFK